MHDLVYTVDFHLNDRLGWFSLLLLNFISVLSNRELKSRPRADALVQGRVCEGVRGL